MSNRLAIDPSEIPIPDYAGIKRRLWGSTPSRPAEGPVPVVKAVRVDFSSDAAPIVVNKPAKPPPKARPKREKPHPPAGPVNVAKFFRVAYASPGADRRPIRKIMAAVARIHHLSVENLTGRNLDKRICDARQHAYYAIATERQDIGYAKIARCFGGRDRTTVMYGASAFAARHGLPAVVRP